MISWTGFIGKLLEFTATKLLGSKLDGSLSQKRKACRAFVSLHDSVVGLESATEEVLRRLKPIEAGEKSLLYSYWFDGVSQKVEDASRDFLKSLDALGPALQIYDPTLSRLLTQLAQAKKAMAYQVTSSLFDEAMIFKIHRTNERSFDYIEATLPRDELLEVDFEGLYRHIKEVSDSHGVLRGEEWPQDVLSDLAKDRIEKMTITKRDIEAARTLCRALRRHLGRVRTGINGLREFIKKEFSIEDVLAATD